MVLDRLRPSADRLLVPVASRMGGITPNTISWLALLAGTLLTMFTAGLRVAAPASQGRNLLPDALVLVNGTQTPLRDLSGSVLALIPPDCACAHLRQLAVQADTAGVQIYIVGTRGVPVTTLTRQTGLGAGHAVEDSENALTTSYHPATLTAVLVNIDGLVARVVPDRGKGFRLTSALRLLTSRRSQGLSRPGRSGMIGIAAGLAAG